MMSVDGGEYILSLDSLFLLFLLLFRWKLQNGWLHHYSENYATVGGTSESYQWHGRAKVIVFYFYLVFLFFL